MSEICAVCRQGKGPEVCEVCGFTDGGAINREWLNKEDAELWLEAVVKPYRVRWEAKKREAELLAQIGELKLNAKHRDATSAKRETELLAQIEALRTKLHTQPSPMLLAQIEELKLRAKQKDAMSAKRETELLAQIKELRTRPHTQPTPETKQNVSIEMIHVRGGTFKMGGKGNDTEKPIHTVTLGDFYIGKFQITQTQWVQVMGSNPSKFSGDNLPVEQVSWNDIQEFIVKLNSMTGRKYRLPTEAEWEYAARGGINSKSYTYAGSNNIDDVAWYKNNSGNKPHPVGTKSPNELGVYDMSGNLWEWVNDWYGTEYYKVSPTINPTGPPSGSDRVFRGGGWCYDAEYCRVSYRYGNKPDNKRNILGFRLALSP